MAKLIAKCQGQRAEVIRISNKDAACSVQGWNSGIKVTATCLEDNIIEYNIYQTQGSNGYKSELMRTVKIDDTTNKIID